MTEIGVPTIRVCITEHDAMAFYKYRFTHEKSIRLTATLLVISSIVASFRISLDLFQHEPLRGRISISIAIAMLISAIAYACFRFVSAQIARHLIRKYPDMLGESDYRLEPKFLAEIAISSEAKYAYDNLRIYNTPRYLYVDTNVGQMLIIPKEGIVGGNLDPFVEELQRRISSP